MNRLFGHLSSAAGALALMSFIVVATGAVLVWLGTDEATFGNLRAAVALPLLLILGLGSLLLLITIMVAVLQGFGLTDRRRAFGLPDGSMQAVIALSLVLIFVIASLYLYSSMPLSISEDETEAAQNRREIAQQLLTTVGTLAVAVAGFYFGTRSVESARATQEVRVPGLRLVWPVSPVELDPAPGQALHPILLEAEPGNRQVTGTVESGDPDGVLEQPRPGEFRYTRGQNAAATVVLTFAFPDGSERQRLVVRHP